MCPFLVETLVSYNPWIPWLWLVKLRSKRERLIVNWSRIFSFNTLYIVTLFQTTKQSVYTEMQVLHVQTSHCWHVMLTVVMGTSVTIRAWLVSTKGQRRKRNVGCAIADARERRWHSRTSTASTALSCVFTFSWTSVLRAQAYARKLPSLYSYHHQSSF